MLHAWDTAADGGGRRAVMGVLRRQAAMTARGGGGDGTREAVLHVCRTARLPEPADPGRVLFPAVHKTGRHRCQGDDRARGERDDPAPRRPGRVHPRPDPAPGGHSLRSGFVTEAFRAGADAHAIMRQTGHRAPAMLEVYAREHAPLIGNAVTRLGL